MNRLKFSEYKKLKNIANSQNKTIVELLESFDMNNFKLRPAYKMPVNEDAPADKEMQEVYKQLVDKPSDAFQTFLNTKASKNIGIGAFGFRAKNLYNNLRKLAGNAFNDILTKLVQPILNASIKTNEIIYKDIISTVKSNPDGDIKQLLAKDIEKAKQSSENIMEKVKQAVSKIVSIYTNKMTTKITDSKVTDKNKTALLAYWTLLTTYIELMLNQYIILKNVESFKKLMSNEQLDQKKQEEVLNVLDNETKAMMNSLNELISKNEKEASAKGDEAGKEQPQQNQTQEQPQNNNNQTQAQ